MNVHDPENLPQKKGGISINPTSGMIHENETTGERETWFSERFTAVTGFGVINILNPSALLNLFVNADDKTLPDLNIGQSADKAGLRHIAEELPSRLGATFPKAWLSLEDCKLPSVSDAIAEVLAHVAMVGVLAEATWRTQLAQACGNYKPSETYAMQVQDVLCNVIAANSDQGPYSEGLVAALDVGAAVIAEFVENARACSVFPEERGVNEVENGGSTEGGADRGTDSDVVPPPYRV